MNKRTGLRNEAIIYIFITLICLSLVFYLINKSDNYSCSQCSVEFKSRLPITNFEKDLSVNITELYNSYKDNICLFQWDKNQGYYRG